MKGLKITDNRFQPLTNHQVIEMLEGKIHDAIGFGDQITYMTPKELTTLIKALKSIRTEQREHAKRNKKAKKFAEQILSNDESSSDGDIHTMLVNAGMDEHLAGIYVAKRDKFLKKI